MYYVELDVGLSRREYGSAVKAVAIDAFHSNIARIVIDFQEELIGADDKVK